MKNRTALIAAPLLVLAYGVLRIVDGLDGVRGPGVAWTVGHLAFLGALTLFVPIFWEMRSMLGRSAVASTALVAGVVGIGCAAAQFTIDIIVGFLAADHDAMSPMFEQVQAVPGVSLAVYSAGPILFYVAQLAFAALLAGHRMVKVWVPVAVLAEIVLSAVNKDLIPVGAVLLFVSFLPLMGRRTPVARHVPAHA
ncbi:hypothetical protein [Nonomuraea guangzhouensis]|uniref:Uncharacterized protein n=1 Tax=Nonomuraea guangzhouensis TaxID=1291555 RepID=A0ABW4G2N2_9ACTN|nr:hypothetical protein [Nonomuraea guangzhouensis]